MRIGWLGLGAMGGPMAACLARAGHQVHGYDIAPDRAAALAAAGGHAAASIPPRQWPAPTWPRSWWPPRTSWTRCCPARTARWPRCPPGRSWRSWPRSGPPPSRKPRPRLSQSGVTVLDAPVSGGVTRAAAGDLLIMVSGPAEAVHRAQPVLDALARTAPVVGPAPGDGQRMKLVNQLLCGVHIAAAAEALAFAEALGLRPADCWQVLRDGAAASFMFDDRGARMVSGQFGRGTQRAGHLRQGHGPGRRGGGRGGRRHAAGPRSRPALRPRSRPGPGPAGRLGTDRGAPGRPPDLAQRQCPGSAVGRRPVSPSDGVSTG